MQIAVLFDEQSPDHEFHAGHTAFQSILGSGILQRSGRRLIVRAGTVLLNHGDPALREQRVEELFFSDSWRLLDANRLRHTLRSSAIFAWVISNIDRVNATRLHASLSAESTYLGLLAVDLSVSAQLVMYRLQLAQVLRIEGRSCNLFWRAFDSDSKDFGMFEDLKSAGFTNVEWEDIGARGTIFDDYDTPDHFSRIEALRLVLSQTLERGTDDADDLLLVLEDLNPRLAATLGTAAGSFLQGRSEEDFAQVGLSARRYCSQLADSLFPPRPEPFNGRDVSEEKVKNRLWAYVEEQLGGPNADLDRLQGFGRNIDRVLEEANIALHGTVTRERAQSLLIDLALLSAVLLALAPESNRNPYFAYSPRISEMVTEWLQPSVDES